MASGLVVAGADVRGCAGGVRVVREEEPMTDKPSTAECIAFLEHWRPRCPYPECGCVGSDGTTALSDCAFPRIAARLRELEAENAELREQNERLSDQCDLEENGALDLSDRLQVMERERDEARAEANKLAESLDYYETLTMCDCCESMTDAPVEADGHMQCESCTKLANARAEVERLTAEATRIVDQQAEQIVALRAEVERLRAELQHQAIDPLDWAMNRGDGT